MIQYNTAVVLVGTSLLGACSGMIGSFAVLRQRALLGDALAHAALPGLCLAFLLVGERSLPAMLLGALASGVLGVVIVAGLRRLTRIKEDASIGIVLSVFFGAGVVLIRLIQNHTTTGSKAGLDSYILGKTAGMILQDVYLIAGVSLVCLLCVAMLYKEFKLVAFDVGFAQVQGWPAVRLDLLLMTLVAVTVVIGLPAVGVVMVAALLILPAVAARFWTDRLGTMLVLSAGFGLVTGAAGTAASAHLSRLPAGSTIVLVGSLVFLLSMLFAPRRGALARLRRQSEFRRRVRDQMLLRAIYDLSEPSLPGMAELDCARLSRESGLSARDFRLARDAAEAQGWLGGYDPERRRLTSTGLARAAAVARGYRLWRLFMEEHAGEVGAFKELDVESVDRLLPPDVVRQLEDSLAAAGRLPTPSGGAGRGLR